MPENKSIVINLILVILLFYFNNIYCQKNGVNIFGKVIDEETSEPLIGINIIISKLNLSEQFQFESGATTDEKGEFETNKLEKGNYKISFQGIGYKEYSEIIDIELNSGKILFNISLSPLAVELDEILVSDEKLTEKNISVINVSTKLLSMLPSISGEVDIFRSLQMLPGVKVASELSNGIYIRGGSPDQNLTLVDGTMIYNPAHLGNIASTFNTHAIYDMKLIKGAFPAEYGGRLSSVLDIKLRKRCIRNWSYQFSFCNRRTNY